MEFAAIRRASLTIFILSSPTISATPRLTLSEASRQPSPAYQFEVTGEVTAQTSYTFVLKDKSGRMEFRNWSQVQWKIGDVVHVTRAQFHNDAPVAIAHLSNIIGHRTPSGPITITPFEMRNSSLELTTVKVSGTVTDVFRDEIDPFWTFIFVEKDASHAVITFYAKPAFPIEDLDALIDAEVSITGLYSKGHSGGRQFLGPTINVYEKNAIVITKPAPSSPFEALEIANFSNDEIDSVLQTGHRCKVSGTVLARMNSTAFLLTTHKGNKLRVHLLSNEPAPHPGDNIEVCGFLKTSPFFLRMSKAVFRMKSSAPSSPVSPTNITPNTILKDTSGAQKIEMAFDGRLVRIKGNVVETAMSFSGENITTLKCDGQCVQVVTTDIPTPEQKALVEVTGICILTESPGNNGSEFPRLTGFTLLTRTQQDIQVLRKAPWWTPGRFLLVVCLLTTTLIVLLVWNRMLNRTVDRRSRELLRKQSAIKNAESRRSDRTRLAVELHDALSQNLAAVALQLSSAKTARSLSNPEAEEMHLSTAEKMLDSSRTELKNCLYDLRSDMLEDHDFEAAICKTIENAIGGAHAEISFNILRSHLDDITAHTILMVIRELVSNAVRHGNAKTVQIQGEINGSQLKFCVKDNGSGFSVPDAPGIDKGHFGIEGIRQRISQVGGEVTFMSKPGNGTVVSASFTLHTCRHQISIE